MAIYFTADCHFNHANIIKYTNRPFRDVIEMNNELIRRWNEVVKPNDIVYHVGDFAFKHKRDTRKITKQLNGTIIHIRGNHDWNNGIKTLIEDATMLFGNEVVLVQHRPPKSVSENYTLVLCGHVHDKWKYKIVDNVLVVNVGVDVWDYRPVSTGKILRFIHKIRKSEGLLETKDRKDIQL